MSPQIRIFDQNVFYKVARYYLEKTFLFYELFCQMNYMAASGPSVFNFEGQ